MSDSNDPAFGYEFARFTLDPERGALRGPEGEIRLRPKSYQLLLYLVRHPGRLVGRDELLNAVWGHVAVTDDSLTQCLVEIRRAIGDDARKIVRTVPRRGYLLDVPVKCVDSQVAAAGSVEPVVTGGAVAATAESRYGPDGRRLLPQLMMLCGAALLLALAWWGLEQRAPSVTVQPAIAVQTVPNSIAVLPFVDMSAEQDQEYFGDGIAEEILNLLVQSPQLHVIARTSSFSFKGQLVDIVGIADRLGVDHVLEGSVRRSGSRVRVTAQLVDGRNSAHLWSQTYDRELGDILDVQADIAASVAEVLRATLQPADRRASGPHDARAYDHFLRGRYFFNRRGEGDTDRARRHFEAAVEFDPDFAAAWAGLAGAWIVLLGDYDAAPDVAIPALTAAADRAVELDPKLPEAHLRAMAARFLEGDPAAGREHMQMAEQLDPENSLLLAMRAGWVVEKGALNEAIELLDRAIIRDPLAFAYRQNQVRFLLSDGRLEQARAAFDAARELAARGDARLAVLESRLLIHEGRFADALAVLEPWSEDGFSAAQLAIAHIALGRIADADAIAASLRATPSSEAAEGLAEYSAFQGEIDEAFAWMAEWRLRMQDSGLPGMNEHWRRLAYSSAFLRPLRDDPRWAAMLAE